MSKKEFHSQLFQRFIKPDEKEYWQYVEAELLYRMKDMGNRNCDCTLCSSKKYQLREYYNKFKKIKPPADDTPAKPNKDH